LGLRHQFSANQHAVPLAPALGAFDPGPCRDRARTGFESRQGGISTGWILRGLGTLTPLRIQRMGFAPVLLADTAVGIQGSVGKKKSRPDAR
jgi:hypothetical protein